MPQECARDSKMTYLTFVLRRAVMIAVMAGLLCVLALLFVLPPLFMMMTP
jgi:hypothetical protein